MVESAVDDQLDAATDQVGAGEAVGLRGAVRPAAQSRAEPRGLGCCCEIEVPHVARERTRRTSGTAVDAGGDNRAESAHRAAAFGGCTAERSGALSLELRSCASLRCSLIAPPSLAVVRNARQIRTWFDARQARQSSRPSR